MPALGAVCGAGGALWNRSLSGGLGRAGVTSSRCFGDFWFLRLCRSPSSVVAAVVVGMLIQRVLVARVRTPRSGMRLTSERTARSEFTSPAGRPNSRGRSICRVDQDATPPLCGYTGAVNNHGSTMARLVAPLVENGIAVFSYDKRGVGESEGNCCTNPGQYNLVAADADGAVLAVRSHPEINADRVGFYGASEAGWVVPLADSRLSKPVAFTALVDGPAVTTGEEKVWSDAAGEDEDEPLTAEKKAEAKQNLQEAGASGFDPAPMIEQMSTPGLWLYGGADKSIPTDRSVEILTRLKRAGKDFTIVVFPNAGHGLVDNVPTAPEAPRPSSNGSRRLRWMARCPAHRGCERLSSLVRPSFEAVGLPGPTLEGGRGCICTLTPSSDWPVVSRW